MDAPWVDRVTLYLDELEAATGAIDDILAATMVQTPSAEPDAVDDASSELTEALAQLEVRVAQRETLLQAADVPAKGLTLTQVIGELPGQEGLARRCDQIAEQIAMANQRAVSLFVCQYHLSDLTTDIVRLLSGASCPPTYGHDTQERSGGALFNEAG